MAEMNELLNQAVEESDGLSAEVARAHETIDHMVQLATSLMQGVDSGGHEVQRLFDQLSARLAEAEAEVTQQNAAALLGLQGLVTASHEVQGQVSDFLRDIRAELADLRKEKEGVREEVERLGDAASANILRYSAQVKDLEEASDTRFASARQQISAFREQVEDVRRDVADRREYLLNSLRGIEQSARQRLDALIQTYDSVEGMVRDQILDLQTTLKNLSEQVVNDVTRKLGQDALEALRNSAEPLKDAIDDMEEFCKRSQKTCSSNFEEIVEKVEEVTKHLEQLRPPLEAVKHHLH